jgi:hypothetical protein
MGFALPRCVAPGAGYPFAQRSARGEVAARSIHPLRVRLEPHEGFLCASCCEARRFCEASTRARERQHHLHLSFPRFLLVAHRVGYPCGECHAESGQLVARGEEYPCASCCEVRRCCEASTRARERQHHLPHPHAYPRFLPFPRFHVVHRAGCPCVVCRVRIRGEGYLCASWCVATRHCEGWRAPERQHPLPLPRAYPRLLRSFPPSHSFHHFLPFHSFHYFLVAQRGRGGCPVGECCARSGERRGGRCAAAGSLRAKRVRVRGS